MLTICEGLDKTGKSTFIRQHVGNMYHEITEVCGFDILNPERKISVLEQLSSIDETVILPAIGLHSDSTDETPFETMMKCIELSKHCDLYLDRSYISEVVYGRVFRGKSRINDAQFTTLLMKLHELPHIILYFKRTLDMTYRNALDNHDLFEDYKKLTLVRNEYAKVMTTLKRFNLNVYEITMTIRGGK